MPLEDEDGDVHVTTDELAQLTKRSFGARDLFVHGSPAPGADLFGIRCRQLNLDDGFPIWAEFVPRRARSTVLRGSVTTYDQVSFDGLRCRAVRFGAIRFVGCSFQNLRVSPGALPISAHFESCVFTGRLDANFWRKSETYDTTRTSSILGNDFSRCSGVSFYDGSDGRTTPSITAGTSSSCAVTPPIGRR